MSTAFIACHYRKKTAHKVRECKTLERDSEMEKSRNHEREKKWCSYHQTSSHSDKQCYCTIRWERRKKSKMGGRKNGLVACRIARIIQIENVFSREVAVNVRTVLLLMIKIAENIKPLLLTAQPWAAGRVAVGTVKLRRSLMKKAKSNIHRHQA